MVAPPRLCSGRLRGRTPVHRHRPRALWHLRSRLRRRAESHRRGRVFVRPGGNGFDIRADGEIWPSLPARRHPEAAGVVSRSGLLSPLADHEILAQGRARGLRSAILLLLDRVGTGGGLPRARLERLRVAGGGLDLMVGGGIASIDDLLFLRQAGFSGALVATALHDGLISRADLRRATLVP